MHCYEKTNTSDYDMKRIVCAQPPTVITAMSEPWNPVLSTINNQARFYPTDNIAFPKI